MQDSENKQEEVQGEDEFSLALFLSYANLDELPMEFFRLLPTYCDKLVTHAERMETLLSNEEEDVINPERDLELACLRASSMTHLSVPSMYRAETSAIPRIPSYKQCESVQSDEFFFI